MNLSYMIKSKVGETDNVQNKTSNHKLLIHTVNYLFLTEQ
jgi:hypothetical protein